MRIYRAPEKIAGMGFACISDGGSAARGGKGGYSERARRFAGAKIALKSAFFRFAACCRAQNACALYIGVFFIAGVSIYCGLTSFLFLTA